MRLMKAFQLQANYQKHKNRLTSINSLNTKKKVTSTTYKNIQFINTYKKHRLTSDIFNQKQKSKYLTHNNTVITQSLTKVYNRQTLHGDWRRKEKKQLSLCRSNSRSSLRSSINSESKRIKQENMKIGKKLQRVKSNYAKFRDTGSLNKSKRQGYKDQLIRLLQNQLGVKPRVAILPRPKNVNNHNNSRNTSSSNINNQHQSRKTRNARSQIHI